MDIQQRNLILLSGSPYNKRNNKEVNDEFVFNEPPPWISTLNQRQYENHLHQNKITDSHLKSLTYVKPMANSSLPKNRNKRNKRGQRSYERKRVEFNCQQQDRMEEILWRKEWRESQCPSTTNIDLSESHNNNH